MTGPKNDRPRPESRRLGEVLPKLVVPLALVIVWVVVSELRLVRPIFLPTPADVWKAFLGLYPLLPRAILTTVAMTLTGFAIGVIIGTASGLLMAYSKTVRDYLGVIFDFARPVPVFALIPLFILWFGIGRAPQITLIAMGTSVILGVTTVEAIRNVPTIYIRAALTLGASRRQIYATVIVPYIAPPSDRRDPSRRRRVSGGWMSPPSSWGPRPASAT